VELGQKVLEKKDRAPIVLLGLFFMIAGLSKFVMLDLWLGFEPAIIINTLPLASEQITLAGGVLETFLGTGLIFGRRNIIFAGLATLWMAAITAQVTRMELYDLAIRDIGLTFYALSVFLLELEAQDLTKS
jgi:uncharacterized membrane protein